MKKYITPEIKENIVVTEGIATLTAWLEGTGSDYVDAGITTYYIES